LSLLDTDARLPEARSLLLFVRRLRHAVAAEGRARAASWWQGIERRRFRLSALNFAHYLALRRRDLRPQQRALMPYGVSSLGRLEGRVLANLDAVIGALSAICGEEPAHYPRPRAFFRGEELFGENTVELFGPQPPGRAGRILVTLPTEAATDPAVLVALVGHGADAVRINCAHDAPDQWQSMIDNLRAGERAAGRRVKVVMDLGGPKVRTGAVWHLPDQRRLMVGGRLLLTRDGLVDSAEEPVPAARSLPEVIDRLVIGERVFIDDGKAGGTVEAVTEQGATVLLSHASRKGMKLKPDKGLNFPDTDLALSALSEDDRRTLDFVAAHADMVGYSFVQCAADIRALQQELAQRRPKDWRGMGVVAKIETPRAVRNLPEIIVAAASRQPLAVMIARGDLAVEIGFERVPEMQEEIMWLCEAAHALQSW
jgi:pyruvate kinase